MVEEPIDVIGLMDMIILLATMMDDYYESLDG